MKDRKAERSFSVLKEMGDVRVRAQGSDLISGLRSPKDLGRSMVSDREQTRRRSLRMVNLELPLGVNPISLGWIEYGQMRKNRFTNILVSELSSM